MTRGHNLEGSQLNIYVDNRPILDTTFLSAEAIEKNFGIRVSRDNHVQLERLVNFLNLAISADKYRSSSTISYANK